MEQPDQVGRTSARLLANGVGRGDRLDALHLLGILDACADATGRVRRPLDDLAAEFDLHPLEVLRGLDHLELAGSVARDGATVVLLERDEDGAGGLLLAEFIDDVRAALDDEQPVPSRWRIRTGAVLVAAAAIVSVLTLAPSRPATAPSVAAGGADERVVSPPRLGSTWRAGGRGGTSAETPAPTVAPSTAVTPVPGAAPPLADAPVVAAACSEKEPVVSVAGSGIDVTNPTPFDVSITALAVDGVRLPVTTFVVPPGGTVSPPVIVPATAREVLLDWDWDDPIIGARCD